MIKLVIFVTIMFILFKLFQTSEASITEHDEAPVVMYSTKWCGYCKKMRTFFLERDINYVEIDIEKSQANHREFKNVGGKGVPHIVINNETIIAGYNPTRVQAELSKLEPDILGEINTLLKDTFQNPK